MSVQGGDKAEMTIRLHPSLDARLEFA